MLAAHHQLSSIAFPAISTGVYGYPRDEAARVAVVTVGEALAETPSIARVIFCCFDRQTHDLYLELLEEFSNA
jgi:O-acetyl-ADP-ribose deacetylase (regulator of RNase III)